MAFNSVANPQSESANSPTDSEFYAKLKALPGFVEVTPGRFDRELFTEGYITDFKKHMKTLKEPSNLAIEVDRKAREDARSTRKIAGLQSAILYLLSSSPFT